MNKLQTEKIMTAVNKAKMCAMGKINEDINSRLPPQPEPLDDWDKYKLIKSGDARLIKNLTRASLRRGRNDRIPLVESYIYPITDEQSTYDKAKKASEQERNDRELAVETAFDRIANERILEVISTKDFLDGLEKLSQQQW